MDAVLPPGGLRKSAKFLVGRASPFWRLVRSPGLRHRAFSDPEDTLLYALSLDRPEARFVCLGANEVGPGDPLGLYLHSGWEGLLVEPVPYIFRRLQQRCKANPRLSLENAVVGPATGLARFHYVEESPDLPRGYDHLGSLSGELLRSHTEVVPELLGRLTCADLPAFTLPDLLAKHRFGRFDLLVMDLEGFDLGALRQADLARHEPLLILYEHAFLGAADASAAEALLRAAGYEVLAMEQDTAAVHAGAGGKLRAAWRVLRRAAEAGSLEVFP